jgi:hypothetical protein
VFTLRFGAGLKARSYDVHARVGRCAAEADLQVRLNQNENPEPNVNTN